jgi:hypothetical protein
MICSVKCCRRHKGDEQQSSIEGGGGEVVFELVLTMEYGLERGSVGELHELFHGNGNRKSRLVS